MIRRRGKPQPYGTVTLGQMLAIAAEADEYDGLMSAERLARMRADDAIDEQLAESGWLRRAESWHWMEELA